jgi:nucleoid DNA-binding protein
MNRQDLVAKISEDVKLTKKQANASLSSILEGISGALSKGDKISLVGFGTFKVTQRKARTGVNPATGKKIKIPARKVPVFKPGKKLKEVV